jgi:3-oxoacyl-[acyl-carrier-protein] synthase-3
MFENYIFSGFGYSFGEYKIKNSDISEAIDKGFLKGFSKDKIQESKKYLEFVKENPNASPFDYFAGHIMGFYERHHVTPFPPTAKKLYYAETSLDLGVKAITEALKDAQIQAREIDAWYVSTVSPHEQAPGIAATIKSYFVNFDNHSPAFTLASGCAGFNMNLERAVEFFKTHPNAKHVIVAHTETMSSFLTQRIKFVPFVTFGDASAAVVVSRTSDSKSYGIQTILNFHDLKMLDYVGVDDKWNLYMDDVLIKDRAIINLPFASNKCIEQTSWTTDDIDIFIPHQTGNVILKPSAERIGIPLNKVFLEGQNFFGNVSGATVPLSFGLLAKQNLLKGNMKILSATAGVGGNFGAFTYIVKDQPKNFSEFYSFQNDLKGKTVLVLGASGSLGYEIAKELERRGADLILHGNNNVEKLKDFKNAQIFKCDFTKNESISLFITQLQKLNMDFDYLVNVAGNLEPEKALDVNFYAPVQIINSICSNIKNTIINVGTAAEDAELSNLDEWISSNRAMHGFLASASGEFLKNGIRIIHFLPGFINNGLSNNIDEKYIFKFMLSVGQVVRLNVNKVSNNVVNSLYLPKVLGVQYSYDNAMLVGRMGYKLEVDV